jgi:protein-L-isoaspartate(D-aspartate) O-methyltransferase
MSTESQFERQRDEMVDRQIRARGVRDPRVLAAMRAVRREGYVPSWLGEFAYDDAPLPIEEEQTISQPYIVARMVEALALRGGERVLEVGTGSGYAAAVLARIAGTVWTIERHERLARRAAERLARDGYLNVHVRHGDGTLGWPEHAPFDAIVVAAGGPQPPPALQQQLAIGGRLVVPVGEADGAQRLLRITRCAADRFATEDLGGVRFVPLVGAQGFQVPPPAPVAPPRPGRLATMVRQAAESFDDVDACDLRPLLARIGSARIVLLGESTHGTSEFYRLRDRITRALVADKGFTIVAAEADWPDAARIDHYVRDRRTPPQEWQAFARFPAWMWRNRETAAFVDWLRQHNLARPHAQRARFAGLDLYALHTSIDLVLRHLDAHDPEAAAVARERYGCLTPWQRDPAAYGRAVATNGYRSCEPKALRMLDDVLAARLRQARQDDEGWFDAEQNARLVAESESYYRAMYQGAHASWNLRDRHMFDCLRRLLDFGGPDSRAVVWAHNSHVGDATATEMAARGEHNLGQLCRQEFGAAPVYVVGFGTHHGEVACASHWGGAMERKRVLPARDDSYEQACHDAGLPNFLLPLRHAPAPLHAALTPARRQRAIGVVYRPETELASHYQHVVLPRQFDEYVWMDATSAVTPLGARELASAPDTWPFGL